MKRQLRLWLLMFGIALGAPSLLAEIDQGGMPFRTRTNHPIRLGGLEPLPERVAPTGGKAFQANADFEYASIFLLSKSDDGTQTAIFDYEVARLNLSGAMQWQESKLHFTFALPLYHFAKGFLDSFLDDYHEIFGLPNSGRHERPHDEFAFHVQDAADQRLFGGESGGLKIGPLALGVQWVEDEGTDLWGGEATYAWRSSLQLPSGDKSAMIGGNLATSVGALGELHWEGWSLTGNLDLIVPLDDDALGHESIKAITWAKLMVSGAMEMWDGGWLRAQIAAATPSRESGPGFYHVDEANVLGTFGVDILIDDTKTFQIAIAEDLNPGVDADFSILFGFSWSID